MVVIDGEGMVPTREAELPGQVRHQAEAGDERMPTPVIASEGAKVVKETALECSEAISSQSPKSVLSCSAVATRRRDSFVSCPGVKTPGYLRRVATRPVWIRADPLARNRVYLGPKPEPWFRPGKHSPGDQIGVGPCRAVGQEPGVSRAKARAMVPPGERFPGRSGPGPWFQPGKHSPGDPRRDGADIYFKYCTLTVCRFWPCVAITKKVPLETGRPVSSRPSQ